jgi:hypothetical protein
LISCWARTRFLPNPWSISSSHWNEIEESDNNDKNSNNEYEFMERAIPLIMKAKKSIHHHTYDDRRKKYLGEATKLQGGRSLQGLWAMPGRR